MGSRACSRLDLDLMDIYHRFCDIKLGKRSLSAVAGHGQDDEQEKANFFKEALAELGKMVESRVDTTTRNIIFNELSKLMPRLDLMGNFSEFSRFYDFVYFMCRENGQKNITVSKAISAWKFVLVGRFRLLNHWCAFVEKNQRYNISEDTWQQVLAFSRCVHENLEGYDPEGAWPVLIDDFVEHMYRELGSNNLLRCNCGDVENLSRAFDDSLPGLKSFAGLKRKLPELKEDEMELSDTLSPKSTNLDPLFKWKRHKIFTQKTDTREHVPADHYMDTVNNIPLTSSSKSPCAVEGCLSKGFADLFSTGFHLNFDRKRRVTYT